MTPRAQSVHLHAASQTALYVCKATVSSRTEPHDHVGLLFRHLNAGDDEDTVVVAGGEVERWKKTKVLRIVFFLLEQGLGYGLVVPFSASYGFAALVSHN